MMGPNDDFTADDCQIEPSAKTQRKSKRIRDSKKKLVFTSEQRAPFKEGSKFVEEASTSGKNAKKSREPTTKDVKMPPLDRLTKFHHYPINGNEGEPKIVASYKPEKIRSGGSGIDCHTSCPEDQLPNGLLLDAECRKSVKNTYSPDLFETFKAKLAELQASINDAAKYNSNATDHQSNSSVLLKCNRCDFSTLLEHLFKRHVSYVHGATKERKYLCPQCDYASEQSGNLKAHVAARHEKDKRFKCPHCKYAAARKRNLQSHMAFRHGEGGKDKKKCPYCEFACFQSSNVKKHIAARHGTDADKHFKCPHCEYASVRSSTLNLHMYSKHGGIL